MTDKEREELDFTRLFNGLLKGDCYGTTLTSVRYPYFSEVLGYNSILNLFWWQHYGEAANKATQMDLRWILDTVFEMTATEFLEKYQTGMEVVDADTHVRYRVQCDDYEHKRKWEIIRIQNCGNTTARNDVWMPLIFETQYEAETYMGNPVNGMY